MVTSLVVTWPTIKQFVDSRDLSIQWIDEYDRYFLKALDGFFALDCVLSKSIDFDAITDFETNYKPNGNQSPNSLVTTQFEQKDKTLKLASFVSADDNNGNFLIQIKIPGTPGSGDGRFISSGMAWFSNQHDDDRISGVYFIDIDGILGTPNVVIGSYTDDELDESQRGWRIPQPRNFIQAETLGFYGFAPSGFYIQINGISGNGHIEGKKMYVNMEWGKRE